MVTTTLTQHKKDQNSYNRPKLAYPNSSLAKHHRRLNSFLIHGHKIFIMQYKDYSNARATSYGHLGYLCTKKMHQYFLFPILHPNCIPATPGLAHPCTSPIFHILVSRHGYLRWKAHKEKMPSSRHPL